MVLIKSEKQSSFNLVFLIILFQFNFNCITSSKILKCCGEYHGKATLKKPDEVDHDHTQHLSSNVNFRLSSHYFVISNQSGNIDWKRESEVDTCHTDETHLTDVFSIHPNDSDSDTGFLENGYLVYNGKHFSPSQYCVNESTESFVRVKALPDTFCDENGNCLRKCCDPLEVYDLSTYGVSRLQCVVSHERPWSPTIHRISSHLDKNKSQLYFKSDHPRNWCKSGDIVLWSLRRIQNDRSSLFRILSNGSVIMKESFDWKSMNTSNLCIDGAINIPGHFDPSNKQTSYSGDEFDTILLECDPQLAKTANPPTVLYGIALAISCIFLLATMIIYGLLWDKQSLHGYTLLGFVTTEFQFYSSLVATFFYLHFYPDPDFTTEAEIFSSFCGIIAVITHFLYICSICWLCVISFDIFSKFRILKLTRARSKNRLKLIIYVIFTITVPSLIVCTGLLLDILYGDDVEVNLILPRYGWNKCFLDLEHAAIPYLFGPIGVLIGLNCLLYLATIFSMYKLQESTKFASASANKVQKQRGKIRLYTKLFLLMGISWIFEVISYLGFGTKTNIPIIIGDMINILQPILIFIIFVCKKDILRNLCQKYSSLGKFFSTIEVEDVIGSTASSSSRGPMLSRFWNPISTTNKWFRSRINSTITDTSNISNQSIRSTLEGIDETPIPASATSA